LKISEQNCNIPTNPFAPLPNSQPVGILELSETRCKWPIDGLTTFYCGQESDGTYCDAHRKLSRGKGTQSERNALRDAIRRDMSVKRETV
jgi:hypothetical protein